MVDIFPRGPGKEGGDDDPRSAVICSSVLPRVSGTWYTPRKQRRRAGGLRMALAGGDCVRQQVTRAEGTKS